MNRLIARCGKGRVQVAISLIFALIVFLACGTGRPFVRTLATAPASAVKLSIWFDGQFASVSTGKTTVLMKVSISDATGSFVLSGKQMLTCDGVKVPNTSGIPLQPPGGAYTFVYTDEQGRQTTLIVPVPQGTFAVTDPAPGAVVPIPKSAQTPPATPISTPRPPEYTSSMPMHYHFPVVPQNATAIVSGWVLSPNGEIDSAGESATGDYTLSDVNTAYGRGFDGLSPGPGTFIFNSTIQWTAPPGGFAAVQILYTDNRRIPVTWTNG